MTPVHPMVAVCAVLCGVAFTAVGLAFVLGPLILIVVGVLMMVAAFAIDLKE